jgi:multicomponent Na+:H+ antiporter subunit A
MESVLDLGISLKFFSDSWSQLFFYLIFGIGALLYVFAWGYLSTKLDKIKFYSLMSIFVVAMLVLVGADNALLLFLAWECTSLVSYLLISFDSDDPKSRKGALTALLITGAGGLFLLAGFTLLQIITKSWSLQVWLSEAPLVLADARGQLAAACVLIGVLSKSAQFPFHFWLPAAMTAPSPVSAFLHSATMVKAGVYLSYRLSPLFSGMPLWTDTLLVCGLVTFAWGACLSIIHTKFKSVLAGTTISMLGVMFLVQGLAAQVPALNALIGPVLFGLVLSHALYKAGYFLIAGTLTHASGAKSFDEISGLGLKSKSLLVASAALFVGAVALPGTPLWHAKSLLLTALSETWAAWALKVGFVALLFMPFRFLAGVFASTRNDILKKSDLEFHAPTSILYLPLITLGVLSVVGALLGSGLGIPELNTLFESLTLTWSAVGKQLLELALVAILYGAVLMGSLRAPFNHLSTSRLLSALRKNPGHQIFESIWDRFLRLAKAMRQLSQPGSMRAYLLTILLALLALWSLAGVGAARLLETSASSLIASTDSLSVAWISVLGGLCLTALLGLVMCLRSNNSLQSIIGLSLVGFSVAGLFSVSGAPDLAMTQFAVECLSLILFFAVLRKLPTFKKEKNPYRTLFDALVAAGFGVVFFATLYLAIQSQALSRLTPYFAEHSLTEGHGRNVVNVILVDFRGFDTMGEISVLAIAGLSIAALLERAMRRRKAETL